jgi:hypothetical protein
MLVTDMGKHPWSMPARPVHLLIWSALLLFSVNPAKALDLPTKALDLFSHLPARGSSDQLERRGKEELEKCHFSKQ